MGEKSPRELRQERKGEGDRDTGKWPLLTAELSPGLPSRLTEPPPHYSLSLSPSLTHTHPADKEDCCLGGGKGSWQFSRAHLLFKKLEPLGSLSLLPFFLFMYYLK